MQRICSIPVAQAMQRHSGGWKADPPSASATPERPVGEEQKQAPALEEPRPEPSKRH
jgi:hypothetical protein